MQYKVHEGATYHEYYNFVGELKPKVFLAQKALARVLNFSVLNSLKLGSNEGMSCPGMIIEAPVNLVNFTFCTQDAARVGADGDAIDATKLLLVLLGSQLLWMRCFTIAEQAGLAGVMLIGDYNGTIVAVFLGFSGASTTHMSLDGRTDTITSVTNT